MSDSKMVCPPLPTFTPDSAISTGLPRLKASEAREEEVRCTVCGAPEADHAPLDKGRCLMKAHEARNKRAIDLTERVTELQALNTKIENERRKYKSLHEATKKLLLAAAIEIPTSIAVMVKGEPFPISDLIREVHERNERLEADAWCNAANELRAFVQAIDSGHVVDLKAWRDRFAEILRR